MYRRLAWIFLLALLLPLAQVSAAAHELSHLNSQGEPGSKSTLVSHCDLCAVAAAVTGGSAAMASALPLIAGPAPEAPLAPPLATVASPAFFAFLSRAPPSFPR